MPDPRIVVGTLQDDEIISPNYATEVYGLSGDDYIVGNHRGETIYAGAASKVSFFIYGDDDTVFAGRGNDKVFGGLGDDDLYGEKGNDRLNGNKGDDYLVGGKDKGSADVELIELVDVFVGDGVFVPTPAPGVGETSAVVPGREDAGSDKVNAPYIGDLPNGESIIRIDNGKDVPITVDLKGQGEEFNGIEIGAGESVILNVGADNRFVWKVFEAGTDNELTNGTNNNLTAKDVDLAGEQAEVDFSIGDRIIGGSGEDEAFYKVGDGVDRIANSVEKLTIDAKGYEVVEVSNPGRDYIIFVDPETGEAKQDALIVYNENATDVHIINEYELLA
ncbi:MAG: calcium-binding protein [Devosia sp.]